MGKYRVLILSDKESWIVSYVKSFADILSSEGHMIIVTDMFPATGEFDFCFMLSYSKLVNKAQLSRSNHNLVVHESALPRGKGWSPLTWQILEGESRITITLFEANERVDSGKIYLQKLLCYAGDELVDELRKRQGEVTVEMCLEFVHNYPDILQRGNEQSGEESFYPRRGPDDSRLDVDKTIGEQFNLLRVVDNEKYPAFFDYNGTRYLLKIYKAEK